MSTELLQSSKGSDDDILKTLCLWEPAFTWLSHGAYVNALFFSHEAQNREDGETGQEAGAAVQEAQHEGVPGNKHGIWRNAPWFSTEKFSFAKQEMDLETGGIQGWVCVGKWDCGKHGSEGFSLRCGCVGVFSLPIPAIPSGSHLTDGS